MRHELNPLLPAFPLPVSFSQGGWDKKIPYIYLVKNPRFMAKWACEPL